MTTHKMGVVNGVYPGFGGPAMTADRAKKIVRLLDGCDIVASTETGRAGCAALGNALGSQWSYQRAQGNAREGLNGLFWNTDRFAFERLWDYTLDSDGQWPRTFIMVRLHEVADTTAFVTAGTFHFAAKGAPLTAAQADRTKWTQVHKVRELLGDKRAILGGDFPRTGDADDIAYLEKEGLRFNGRTHRTPLVTITQHRVTVLKTEIVETGSLLDHDIPITTFTLPGKAAA